MTKANSKTVQVGRGGSVHSDASVIDVSIGNAVKVATTFFAAIAESVSRKFRC